MWICLKQGFFSIVQNSQGPGMMLRARSAQHLNLLKRQCPVFHRLPTIATTDSDYPFRIVITTRQFEQFGQWCVSQVDYTNFKNAVEDNTNDPQNPYLGFLHELWHMSREWLQPTHRKPPQKRKLF